jgi:hypothetical protein
VEEGRRGSRGDAEARRDGDEGGRSDTGEGRGKNKAIDNDVAYKVTPETYNTTHDAQKKTKDYKIIVEPLTCILRHTIVNQRHYARFQHKRFIAFLTGNG